MDGKLQRRILPELPTQSSKPYGIVGCHHEVVLVKERLCNMEQHASYGKKAHTFASSTEELGISRMTNGNTKLQRRSLPPTMAETTRELLHMTHLG